MLGGTYSATRKESEQIVYSLIPCKKIAFYAATEWWVSTFFVVGRQVVSSIA